MKKLALLPLLALALALPATANAWTYSLAGTAACNPATGQYDVSWTIDNSSEPQTLTFSSRLGSGSASAGGSATQSEAVSGSATSAGLAVSGGWPSDLGPHARSASVSLAGTCRVPVTPVVVPPMGDDCPNLDGVQGSVPEGMIRDSEGNCVTRPTTSTESQSTVSEPITSPPAALAPTPVVVPPASAPVVVANKSTEGVAGATKTKVTRKAVLKTKKAKKAKKFSAGGIKGAKPSALPRTR